MEFLKKTLSFVALAGLLTGCQLTEEEKQKIEQAGENLEKIAVAPYISFPAEGDTIYAATPIRLDVDNSVVYKSMSLLVDGIEVAIDTEAPYEFNWDPYFWSENQKSTFIIRAITEGDNLLRSAIRTVAIGDDVHNLVKIDNPLNNHVFKNVDSVNISWLARDGAESYDYRINGAVSNTAQVTESINLPTIGDYSVAVRAVNSLGYKGLWSDEVVVSLAALNTPSIVYPSENTVINNVTPIRLVADDAVAYKSMTLLVDGIEMSVDYEAPYEFSWDPYFWSENQNAKISVRAVTQDDDLLSSDIRTLLIGADVHNLVTLDNPVDGQVFRNVNATDIAWHARVGAVSYDYKVNGSTYNTDQTTASIDLPEIGNYGLSVRAIDSLGYKGKWSDESRISLAIPSAPSIYSSDPVSSENDWQVLINWTGAFASSELQIATDLDFTSILENEDLVTTSYSASLVAGIYYARVRTTNEFGYISQWSEVSSVEVGMFSTKIDMHTYGGWSNEDGPVDFVIEDENLVITAWTSNKADASGDDFYVSKVNLQGEVSWGKSYKPQINNPKSIAKTSNGYVLPGNGTSWKDGKVIALDDLGNQAWVASYNSSEDLSAGDHGIYTRQRLENILEVSPNKYIALQRTLNCIYTGPAYDWGGRPSSCPNDNIENKVKFIDRSGDAPVISDYQIAQPASGKYDQFTQLLLTDSGLYAAGRYTAANDSSQDSSADDFTPSSSASGAVLLKLSTTDGSIISARTAGGIKDSTLTSIAETKSGDIVVGYNSYYAGVTSTFKSDGNSDSKIDGSQRYAHVVADPNGDGYITLAQHRNVDDYYLTRYNEANVKVGESKRLSQCFNELRAKKIKSHPKHGVVILGTDKWGSSYSDTHTVYFNVTKDFNYLCPE